MDRLLRSITETLNFLVQAPFSRLVIIWVVALLGLAPIVFVAGLVSWGLMVGFQFLHVLSIMGAALGFWFMALLVYVAVPTPVLICIGRITGYRKLFVLLWFDLLSVVVVLGYPAIVAFLLIHT